MESMMNIKNYHLSPNEECILLKQKFAKSDLTDYAKVEIAMNFDVITAYEDKTDVRLKKRQKIAKIIGSTETNVQRSLYIMTHGTEEQKRRARRGGFENDGRANTLSTISNEIRDRIEFTVPQQIKPREETERVCKECGRLLPITKFAVNKGNYRNRTCNKCRNEKYNKDRSISGEILPTADISMTADELNDYLYNKDNKVDYTLEDMLEEIKINGENGINLIATTLEIHKDVLLSENDKQKAMELITTLSHKLFKLNQLIKE